MPRPVRLVVALLATAAAALGPAAAASAAGEPSGHDVSFPQCGRALPARGDVAVVGVNAGTGTTTNPCIAEQLAWGDSPAADGSARRADVYVNTANPGHLADWWPAADLTRTGLPVPNPYGPCRGAEDAACAYVYGWSTATDDLNVRGVVAPGARTWWLDVETVNTWSWDGRANRAVLEGMADAVRRTGAEIGLYSTSRQWALIAGSVPATSPLAGAPAWLSGAVTHAGAEANCAAAPLTPGGSIRMVQWVPGGLDRDAACAPAAPAPRAPAASTPDPPTVSAPPPTASSPSPAIAPAGHGPLAGL